PDRWRPGDRGDRQRAPVSYPPLPGGPPPLPARRTDRDRTPPAAAARSAVVAAADRAPCLVAALCAGPGLYAPERGRFRPGGRAGARRLGAGAAPAQPDRPCRRHAQRLRPAGRAAALAAAMA